MKNLGSKLTWSLAIGVVSAFGLFLVAFAILNAAGFQINDLLALRPQVKPIGSLPISQIPVPRPKQKHDEVKSYTLFTTVEHGPHSVVTGTQYASSQNQIIEHEWCYIDTPSQSGAVSEKLTLASIDQSGQLTIPDFSKSALQTFQMTKDSVLELIGNHCRFQGKVKSLKRESRQEIPPKNLRKRQKRRDRDA